LFVVLADLRISAFGTICDVKPVCTPRTDLSCAACILTSQNRVQGSNPLVPTDHGIKTPPDKKGEKSGGVPNVWKDFGAYLLTP